MGFRTNCGRANVSVSQFTILMVGVALLAVHNPIPCVARLMVLNSTTSSKVSLATDLVQYHHYSSPYARLNLTLAERVEIAVKSSRERAQSLHNKISGKQATFGVEAVFSSPLYSGQGSYLMQFQIGTPARKFVAIADTGSDLVWVQCSPCTRCFSQPDAVFKPSASSTYKSVPCANNALCSALPFIAKPCSSTSTCLYQYGYGDQSTTQGDFASETVTLSTTTGTTQSFPNFGFGCGHNNQGTFTGSDGLVGLGQGPLSLIAQLGSQFSYLFSYCLVDFYSATTKTSPLLFGGTGGASLTYTPLVRNSVNPTFYYINLVGITIAGKALQYPADTFAIDSSGNGGFILDSGTTITQLPSAAYSPLLSTLTSLITGYPVVDGSNQGFDLCFDLSGVASPAFPSVVFQFQGLNVALPGSNLFLQVDNAGTYCLAFQGFDAGIAIFGNVQQQNFQIAYDLANQRVGFAPKTC